jgi:hypothetical protein
MSDRFVDTFDHYQNRHTIAWFLYLQAYRWFGVRSLAMIAIYVSVIIVVTLVWKDGKCRWIVRLFPLACIAISIGHVKDDAIQHA